MTHLTHIEPADLGEADRALKTKHRAMWASGNYPAVVTDAVGPLGPILVDAAGIKAISTIKWSRWSWLSQPVSAHSRELQPAEVGSHARESKVMREMVANCSRPLRFLQSMLMPVQIATRACSSRRHPI